MGNLHGIHRSHHGGSNFPGEAPNSPFPPPYTAAPAPAPAPSSPSDHHMTVGPYCHVDSSLRSLAGKAEGFGRAAVGGLNGPICHVTSLAGKFQKSPFSFIYPSNSWIYIFFLFNLQFSVLLLQIEKKYDQVICQPNTPNRNKTSKVI